MKQASAELIQFLASESSETMKFADLYKITLKTGTVLCYTSADFNISYNNNLYIAIGNDAPNIKRSEVSWQMGLSVDDLTLEFNPTPNNTIGSLTMIEGFRNGLFDGASFQLDFAFFKDGWNASPLVLEKVFVGTLDVEEITGSYVKTCVSSPMALLSCNFPANCYQASCHHTLYGAGCDVNKANYSETQKTIGANSTKQKIYCTLTKPVGYYTNGTIVFLDGENGGSKRGVKVHENGELTLSMPLLFTPQANEHFSVYAGCNKSIDMCKSKFNNLANFGGTPFVPSADSIV